MAARTSILAGRVFSIVQISTMALSDEGNFNPLTAEQMQAAAITEGNVSIRRGSVTKRETVIYLGINVKNNVKA